MFLHSIRNAEHHLPQSFSLSPLRRLQLFSVMNGSSLNLDNPIGDAISRIRFAPTSNNLLIASWDSSLRLYDVDRCELRLEAPSGGAALLDCCFESETVALSANSDGSILRYDMHLGSGRAIGKHDDLTRFVEYSEGTCQIISAGWDKKVKFWDVRCGSFGSLSNLDVGVESMSLSGFNLMVGHKSSVLIYDLRYLEGHIQAKEHFMDIDVKCVRSNLDLEGFVVGSIDGRVALEYLDKSNSRNEGYAFRCHRKDMNGRHYLEAVNDIAFSPSLSGVLVTGDDNGHAIIWNILRRKRLVELPSYPNSVASLAYNHNGQLLAVASSCTYQEANEREELPQIFMHQMDDKQIESVSTSSST